MVVNLIFFIGWLLLAAIMFVFASLLGLFPKTLPRAAVRKAQERSKGQEQKREAEMPASLSGKTSVDDVLFFQIKNKISFLNA